MNKFEFKYAIQNKDGLYYRGSVYGNQKDWTNIPMYVFTYTYEGASLQLTYINLTVMSHT
jgi:hypothetical protein